MAILASAAQCHAQRYGPRSNQATARLATGAMPATIVLSREPMPQNPYATRDPSLVRFSADSVWYVPVATDAVLQPVGWLWPHNQNVLGDGAQGPLPSDTYEFRKYTYPQDGAFYAPETQRPDVERYTADEEPFIPWRDLDGDTQQEFALYRAGKRRSGRTGDLWGEWVAGFNDNILRNSDSAVGTTVVNDYDEDFEQGSEDNWVLIALNKCAANVTWISTNSTYNAAGAMVTRLDKYGKPTANVNEGVHAVLFQGQPMERRNRIRDYRDASEHSEWVDASNRQYGVVWSRVPAISDGFISLFAGRNKSYLIDVGIRPSLQHDDVRDESRYGSHGGSNTSAAVGISSFEIDDIYINDNFEAINHCLKCGIAPMISYSPLYAGGDRTREYQYEHVRDAPACIWPASRADEGWDEFRDFDGRSERFFNNPDASFYSGGNPHLRRGTRLCLPRAIQGRSLVLTYDPPGARRARETRNGSSVVWRFETKLGCALAVAAQKFGIIVDDGNGRKRLFDKESYVWDPEVSPNLAPYDDSVGQRLPQSALQFAWRMETLFSTRTFRVAGERQNSSTGHVSEEKIALWGSSVDRASHYLFSVDGVTRDGVARYGGSKFLNEFGSKFKWERNLDSPNAWSRDNDWIWGHVCVVVGTSYDNPGGGSMGVAKIDERPAISFVGGTFRVRGSVLRAHHIAEISVWRATNASGDGEWVKVTQDVFNRSLENRASPDDLATDKIIFGDLDEGVYQFRVTGDNDEILRSRPITVVWNKAEVDLLIDLT